MTEPRVIHFEILGDDQKALQAFWGEVFGLKFDTNNQGGYGMSDPAQTGIVFGVGEKRGPVGHVTAYVRVADINATAAKAVALGGSVIMPRFSAGPNAWLGVIADPEGHIVGLSE
jgi:predicted enzyme related to lactoylglutathione lyase